MTLQHGLGVRRLVVQVVHDRLLVHRLGHVLEHIVGHSNPGVCLRGVDMEAGVGMRLSLGRGLQKRSVELPIGEFIWRRELDRQGRTIPRAAGRSPESALGPGGMRRRTLSQRELAEALEERTCAWRSTGELESEPTEIQDIAFRKDVK